jgi:hypothetical protein
MTAARLTFGAISLSSSNHFPLIRQQLRQFRDIRRNPPRLILTEQLGGGALAGLWPPLPLPQIIWRWLYALCMGFTGLLPRQEARSGSLTIGRAAGCSR